MHAIVIVIVIGVGERSDLTMTAERCTRCGGDMESRREGSAQGLFCKSCDWSVVTTRIPAILLDETIYEVRLMGGDFRNDTHIKAVAEASGQNFLGARKQLQEREPLVYKGHAPEVARAAAVLTAAGMSVQITPPFPPFPS
jgi:hypothetical protein